MMTKLLIGGAVAALLVTFAPSVAQPAPPPGVAQGTAPIADGHPVAPVAPRPGQVRVRVMGDRVMTRAEVDQHVRRLFARFDANHDGFITRDEMTSVATGMMAMHGDIARRMPEQGMMGDRNAMFDRLDTNHDGNISRQEFMAGPARVHAEHMIVMHRGSEGSDSGRPPMPGMPQMRGMHMGMGMGAFGGRLFEMADANHDGRVSLQEAEAAALAHFDRADLNHDGKLTPEERRQAHQLMHHHPPS